MADWVVGFVAVKGLEFIRPFTPWRCRSVGFED